MVNSSGVPNKFRTFGHVDSIITTCPSYRKKTCRLTSLDAGGHNHFQSQLQESTEGETQQRFGLLANHE